MCKSVCIIHNILQWYQNIKNFVIQYKHVGLFVEINEKVALVNVIVLVALAQIPTVKVNVCIGLYIQWLV